MPDSKENTSNCNFPKFEKNKYFYGKLMTVRDFETEQNYFDGKRCLLNRLLHGMGILCGFKEAIINKNNIDETFTINFIDGGMALTYFGNEIVVPPNTKKQIKDEYGKPIKDLTSMYLYLKYNPIDEGYVSVASNNSSCKEKCCPGRAVDDFEVLALSSFHKYGIECSNELSSKWLKDHGESQWLQKLEENRQKCPPYEENQVDMVFLGIVDENYLVKKNGSERDRIFFTHQELYQLLKCHIGSFEFHVSDIKNPHEVTASQTGALVSIAGVSNPGGNIDLVKDNSIVITTSPDKEKSITIGETHSARMDNPHEVTAHQTGALVSVDGVSNPGGNIDLIEGTNIIITPGSDSIKIDCNIKPAGTVHSIGTKNFVGESSKYAREDHVHKLEGYPNPPIFLLRLLALLLVILIILVVILILR